MCDVNAFDFLSGRSFVGRPLSFLLKNIPA